MSDSYPLLQVYLAKPFAESKLVFIVCKALQSTANAFFPPRFAAQTEVIKGATMHFLLDQLNSCKGYFLEISISMYLYISIFFIKVSTLSLVA